MSYKDYTNNYIYANSLLVEAMVKAMVINGQDSEDEIVKAVSITFQPQTDEEKIAYSEAIVFTRLGILN